ncbi:TonB-dependent receptor domain-containing protein [Phenylobacterium sp. J367]|uniref:TonB-dependent receptor domain-containing protein n=1 Tax=Phenylobacterium sp. J367 TaxID=2898435 RepID=UPI0021518311|nr:TonB-dependent receptor [Phenylobacterium sp. J367]MCR5877952.1 TonB-dependent receptor [Phenylobacterium sp. J367]
MKNHLFVLASPLVLLASGALAQPASPPTAKPAQAAPPAEGKTVGEVVVSGAAPDVRTSIDRTSYNVAKDLQATTGSIGDALRGVPSVEVDVQGNVALRGDPNVTIMIDGKPSGMFKGEGRAAALQSLPADQIERVEVITNPTAAFDPEGGAGVINLITKKTRKPGYSGSLRANYGSEGRANVGGSAGYNSARLTVTADAAYRTDPQKFWLTNEREVLDATGATVLTSRERDISRGDGRIYNGRLSADYDVTAADRLSGELRFIDMKPSVATYEHYEAQDASGALTRVFDRTGEQDFQRRNGEISGTWRRKLEGQDHELVVNGSLERTDLTGDRDQALVTSLPEPPLQARERFSQDTRLDQVELKVDYTRPMPDEAKLKAGYVLQIDENDYLNTAARGLAGGPLVPDLNFSNRFTYDQTVHQAYATYERPFGDFTVLAGLRVESVEIDINQITTNIQATNDYTEAYPSLHLAYQLGEGERLSASYSRRVQRPNANDLNPFLVYIDPANYRRGNPDLKPQITDSFEAAWQKRDGGTLYIGTLFYRVSHDGVIDVTEDIGQGILVTTRENAGQVRTAGLELVANGRLSKTITYNLSGNVGWQELDAGDLGFAETRDGFTVGGRANLNWQVTSKDFIQLNGFVNGERLTAQGYRKASGLLNLGYRHKFSDKVSGVVTVQDVLNTFKDVQVIDTDTLRDRTVRDGNFRGVFVGLTWTFGGQGKAARDPGFDFGGGGGPPG